MRSNKGATCKSLVLDDGGFWSRVTTHVGTTTPIFKMLRRFDTGSPTVGKLYSSWFELGEHLKTQPSDYQNVATEKHGERWAYGHAAIAGAAYVVDPEFYSHNQETNVEVMEGFMETVEKIAVLIEVRKAAAASDELAKQWKARADLINKDPMAQKTFTHYPKYPTEKDAAVKAFCAKANAQLALYRGKKGIFAREWIFDSAENMPAYLWWDSNAARACPSSRSSRGKSSRSPPPRRSASASTASSHSSRTRGATASAMRRPTSSWASSTTCASSPRRRSPRTTSRPSVGTIRGLQHGPRQVRRL